MDKSRPTSGQDKPPCAEFCAKLFVPHLSYLDLRPYVQDYLEAAARSEEEMVGQQESCQFC